MLLATDQSAPRASTRRRPPIPLASELPGDSKPRRVGVAAKKVGKLLATPCARLVPDLRAPNRCCGMQRSKICGRNRAMRMLATICGTSGWRLSRLVGRGKGHPEMDNVYRPSSAATASLLQGKRFFWLVAAVSAICEGFSGCKAPASTPLRGTGLCSSAAGHNHRCDGTLHSFNAHAESVAHRTRNC